MDEMEDQESENMFSDDDGSRSMGSQSGQDNMLPDTVKEDPII